MRVLAPTQLRMEWSLCGKSRDYGWYGGTYSNKVICCPSDTRCSYRAQQTQRPHSHSITKTTPWAMRYAT